jgi:hypothetical protein
MPSLKAQSISTTIRAWLHNPHHARILHLFGQAINLIAGDTVIAIVTPAIGDGPFNIVIPPIDFTHHTTPADPVRLSPTEIHIGPLTIDLSAAALWNPHPDWNHLRQNCALLQRQAPIIYSALHQRAPANSLARLIVDLPDPSSDLDARFVDTTRQHWRNIYQAALDLDQVACTTYVKRLVGLGSGLTPAGDDWLLGCALVAHLDLPSPAAASILLNAARSAAPGTTPLSMNWLLAAAAGAFNANWHALLDSCLRADSDAVRRTASRIIVHGHTSGADAIAGYFAMLANHHV